MRNIRASYIIVIALFLGAACAEAPAKLVLHFFGSSTCGECAEIKTTLLQPFAARFSGKVDLQVHDIDSDSGFQLLANMEEKYKVPASSPQELFFPDTFLLGYESIIKNGPRMLEYYVTHPEKWENRAAAAVDSVDLANAIKKRIETFTIMGIIGAGLFDGINPCAIATMIFLISFLAVQKRKRSEVLLIGLTFTTAVFVTYTLLGLGAFKALSLLKSYYWIATAIRWTAVAFAAIVAVVCFRDAVVYRKTGKAKDIMLQLPNALKLRIHKVISGNLSKRGLFAGTAAAGFLVTLLEAVCTGQVYLPTIVLMTRVEGFKATGWLLLLFYNFLFVLPLLIVMVLAYFGLRWDELSRTTQKHLPLMKIAMGTVLLGLAVFLAVVK